MLDSVLVLNQVLSERDAFEGAKGEFCSIHLSRAIPRQINGIEF